MSGLDLKGLTSSIFHDLWLDSKPPTASFGSTMLRRNCLTQNPENRRNTPWLVVVAQLVEPQIVVLVVAGSSPVDHPITHRLDNYLVCLSPKAYLKVGPSSYA